MKKWKTERGKDNKDLLENTIGDPKVEAEGNRIIDVKSLSNDGEVDCVRRGPHVSKGLFVRSKESSCGGCCDSEYFSGEFGRRWRRRRRDRRMR